MKRNNKKLFYVILLIYLLIPIILYFNAFLFEIKFYILTVVGILIYFLLRFNRINNNQLGITKVNAIKSIKRNIIFSTIFVICIIILKIFNLDKFNPDETLLFYFFYIFISCPIQEFLYRGVFGYFEDKIFSNKYIIIILSSLFYSFVHIIYKDVLTLVLTFIVGIIWYYIYKKDNNLIGVSISHSILGILTILLGII